MIAALCLLVSVAAVLVATIGIVTRRQRLEIREQAWRPRELKNATVEFAERVFHARWPFRLYAKIDRAYKTSDGVLVLTELKRRFGRQAYASDVVELSAQKLAIERGARRSVAATGFVVIEHPASRERIPIRVSLLAESELVALRERYQLLVDGKAAPDKANDVRLCRSCAYVDRCKPYLLLNDRVPPNEKQAISQTKSSVAGRREQLNAAAVKAGPPARRRATARSPGKSKTKVRNSPGSGQSHTT